MRDRSRATELRRHLDAVPAGTWVECPQCRTPLYRPREFLLAHGHIDAVVPRGELHAVLGRLVAFHAAAEAGERPVAAGGRAVPAAATDRDPWEGVGLARHPQRPLAEEYLAGLVTDFVELRGDRDSGDDPAVVGGLGRLGGAPVVVVAHRKGRGSRDAVARNVGMPQLLRHDVFRAGTHRLDFLDRYLTPHGVLEPEETR